MQIQINTDSSVNGGQDLLRQAEDIIGAAVARFVERITRVEAHLSDVNQGKAGADDKRCVLEARVAGMSPVVVRHQAATLEQAVNGAADKLGSALDRALGRQRTH